jgi:uncharacterized protein (TIGR02246 family)
MSFTGPFEDRLAIRELIESYADAVTRRDAEAWAATWADDARWLMPALNVSLDGKPMIVSSWIDMMAQFHGPADAPWAFSFVSVLGGMQVDGDRATVRSYSVEAFVDATGKTVHLKGQYDDVVVRRDGRWLFLERVWRLLPLEDAAAFLAG